MSRSPSGRVVAGAREDGVVRAAITNGADMAASCRLYEKRLG